MRIVFEITAPWLASGGGKPYSNLPGKMGYGSMQVDLMISQDCAENHADLGMFDDDPMPIYIEGDSKYIIPALEKALDCLKYCEVHMKDRLGEVRDTNCPDGCAGIEEFNGNHSVNCSRHPNYEILKAKESGSEN